MSSGAIFVNFLKIFKMLQKVSGRVQEGPRSPPDQSVFIQPQSPGALRSFLVVFLGVVFSRGLTRMTRVFEILSCLLSCMERSLLPEVVFSFSKKTKIRPAFFIGAVI